MLHATPTAPRVSHAHTNRDATSVRTDKQLLRQFLAGPKEPAEAAFAALVERYSPIVHRVCFDALGCSHDAQDAAQAAFLVLAGKARAIRKPESLGPWLHGVAVRVARRASREAARRVVVERKKAEMTQERDVTNSGSEIMDYTQLHEEIDRLPGKYRQPIILCYLQGQTQTEAAQTLGWPLGTVQIRLHRGRERLRSRLTRRGTGVVALAGSELTAPRAAFPGSLGRDWTETTACAAVRFAAGKDTAGLVAGPVAGLANSVLTGMLLDSLKFPALSAIPFLLVSAAVLLTFPARERARPQRSPIETKSDPAPSTKPEPAVGLPIPRNAPVIVDGTVLAKEPVAQLTHEPSISTPTKVGPEKGHTPGTPPSEKGAGEGAIVTSPALPAQPLRVAAVTRRSEKGLSPGRELFERFWVKNDPRSHGGDGLGPVFNGQSCVACHNLGGPGGAGGVDKNIEIASASDAFGEGMAYSYSFSMDFGTGRFEYQLGGDPTALSRRRTQSDSTLLARIHPGFRDANSTVLHQYGTDPAYQAWRGSVPGRHDSTLIRTSQRNPPSLFGLGLIDAISDEAIEAAARRKSAGSAQVKGRVSRVTDGRIGRFGWKAQTATLGDFVRSAAAGEIGLEIPGRHQAADPRLPGLAATGLDMNEGECEALVEYVRSLRAPAVIEPPDDRESISPKPGEATFKSIGCAACHTPKLGKVEGIYSDLLLHDMGPQLADSDAYSVFVGELPRAEGVPIGDRARADVGTASLREWRTPPLWGIRDSGPYLHDGRAKSLSEAIVLHAGQGAQAARRYAELSPRRKQQIDAFLLSLAPPSAD
jgi:RNA polymerase sigma factor (sigma-70 family)